MIVPSLSSFNLSTSMATASAMATPDAFSTTETRPLLLTLDSINVPITVPVGLYSETRQLRDAFLRSNQKQNQQNSGSETVDKEATNDDFKVNSTTELEMVHLAKFMAFASLSTQKTASTSLLTSSVSAIKILKVIFLQFVEKYLDKGKDDIHTTCQLFEKSNRVLIQRTFFDTLFFLRSPLNHQTQRDFRLVVSHENDLFALFDSNTNTKEDENSNNHNNDNHHNSDDYKEHDLDQMADTASVAAVIPTYNSNNNNNNNNFIDKLRLTLSEYSTPSSALLTAAEQGQAKILVIFGGQGNTHRIFTELDELYQIYGNLVLDFVKEMTLVIQEMIEKDSTLKRWHPKGLDLVTWLTNPEMRPDQEYLLSCRVAMVVYGLTHFLHYYVTMKVLDKTPEQLRNLFVGTTGHSQGIVPALVIACSGTMDEYFYYCRKAIRLLISTGTRSFAFYPPISIDPILVQDSIQHEEGSPSCMLLIVGLPLFKLVKIVQHLNQSLSFDQQILFGLRNHERSNVCCGYPESLYLLNLNLRKLKVGKQGTEKNQDRIPFSERKLKFLTRFLPTSGPYHTSYLKGCLDSIRLDCERFQFGFDSKEIKMMLKSSFSGTDMRFDSFLSSNDFTMEIIQLMLTKMVDWEKAIQVPNLTHILEFGPGGDSGVGGMMATLLLGQGIQVVLGTTNHGPNSGLVLYKPDLLNPHPKTGLRFASNWFKEYQPRLIKTKHDNKIHLDTRMSRLLTKPPLMVAGMTPTTVNEQFLTAVIQAGYHVELAGGGLYSESAVRDKINKIVTLNKPGSGITLNTLYINPRQWGFQMPLVSKMCKEGLPIEGFCCAAGVPSLEVATEFISEMLVAGIRHVSFKPGSVDGIRKVLAIAASNKNMAIILQWTGGRAGGHHSFEDFHQPILDTYSSIRRLSNVVLVAGSGFGGAKDTLPYMTGDWSVEMGYAAMPFDGILFGSRVMVAKEGLASLDVKQAIVDAPGLVDAEWENTYKGPAGGIITVKSEMGEPIHKIATRGVKLWKELDDTIFSLPKAKRADALKVKKSYIIARLNADFQKVWFGKKQDDSVAELEEMTYQEVIDRLVDLLYIKHEDRWIDLSHRDLVGDVLRRVEERFTNERKDSMVQSYTRLQIPFDFVQQFIEAHPLTKTQLLCTEDVNYFLLLMDRRGQKPVPFIPVLDQDFEVWFKKDSLWQVEDLSAVMDQDVQRTCILQGPTAARYSTKVNEPVKEILDDILNSHIQSIKERFYENDDSLIPEVEYLGQPVVESFEDAAKNSELFTTKVIKSKNGDLISVALSRSENEPLPRSSDWIEFLAGPNKSWFRAMMTCRTILREKLLVDNPVCRVFKPRHSQLIKFDYDDDTTGELKSVEIFDDRLWASTTTKTAIKDRTNVEPCVRATILPNTNNLGSRRIELTLFEKFNNQMIPYQLLFDYKPRDGANNLVHEVVDGRNKRSKVFYHQVWFPSSTVQEFETMYQSSPLTDLATSNNHNNNNGDTLTEDLVQRYCQIIDNRSELFLPGRQSTMYAPMDMAALLSWKALCSVLISEKVDIDIFNLVHFRAGFRMLNNTSMLEIGNKIESSVETTSITNTSSGKLIQVLGTLTRQEDGQAVMEISSDYLVRGHFSDFETTFQKSIEPLTNVVLTCIKDVAILKSKEWIQWDTEFEKNNHQIWKTVSVKTPIILQFNLKSLNRFGTDLNIFAAAETSGTIQLKTTNNQWVQVGKVDYCQSGTEAQGNLVLGYLKRHGLPVEEVVYFENGGYLLIPEPTNNSKSIGSMAPNEFVAAATNDDYSAVSGDANPIHTNPYFANLVNLPGTITHGMWTSAATRRLVETLAAENHPERVASYQVTFLSTVLPGDRLTTKLWHVGMKKGKKMIKVETFNQDDIKVLEGTAEVEQPPTVYVFTGQGSQAVGMGMDLYDSSPVAKDVWDSAEQHFMENYGFSILDIVRNNSTELTIFFGGAHGKRIRSNYMSMKYETKTISGESQLVPIFPTITSKSRSYTFHSPTGLLNATQFTQPALVIMETAMIRDMKSKQLIQDQSTTLFAGHSLGEYASLTAIGEAFSLKSILDTCFYRGMTFQVAVPRNFKNQSDYGMVAVNPSRVAKHFSDDMLRFVVQEITLTRIQHNKKNGLDGKGQLVELVNENIRGQQYVAAGDLVGLEVLKRVLDKLATDKTTFDCLIKFTKDLSSTRNDFSKIKNVIENELEMVVLLADSCLDRKLVGPLTRGLATLPLEIDVPFHSSFMNPNVDPFRMRLLQKISVQDIHLERLVNRYIPNVMAKPFSVQKSYIQEAFETTKSLRLGELLENWDNFVNQLQTVAYILLVELLAYQLAFPVRWIETQDLLFEKNSGSMRLIEVGPSPILCGMAQKTFQAKSAAAGSISLNRPSILCTSKDTSDIHYLLSDAAGSPAQLSTTSASKVVTSTKVIPAPMIQVLPVVSAIPAEPLSDVSLKALDVVRIMVAQKLKQSVSEISGSKTIKDLSGGKSTLQNEILGDLQKEFGTNSVPEKAEDLSLNELGSNLQNNNHYSGSSLGPQTTAMVNRLMSTKMPGGFGLAIVKAYLLKSFGLSSLCADGALLFGTTMEPTTRFSSEAEAKVWLSIVAQGYATLIGISLSSGGSVAPTAVVNKAPVVSTGSVVPIEDAPLRAVDIIHTIVAQKLKQPLQAVPLSKSIKDLSGGKSTLQNEIVGDLQKEFGTSTVPEKSEELSLEELGNTLQSSFRGNSLGPHSTGLVSKLMSSKMPGGFTYSSAKNYLTSQFGLGPLRIEAVLLFSLTMEPSARLGSESEAKSWLNTVAKLYAQQFGISLGSNIGNGVTFESASMTATTGSIPMNSEEFNQFQSQHSILMRQQLELYARFLYKDLRSGDKLYETEKETTKKLQAEVDQWLIEHGEVYANGILPVFDSKKVRKFDSSWNWVRQDALILLCDIKFGKTEELDRNLIAARCLQITNRADQSLLDFLTFHVGQLKMEPENEKNGLVQQLGEKLIEDCKKAMSLAPVYKEYSPSLGPKTTIDHRGNMTYQETERVGTLTMEDYVKEMSQPLNVTNEFLPSHNLDVTIVNLGHSHDGSTSSFDACSEIQSGSSSPVLIGHKPTEPLDTPLLHLKHNNRKSSRHWELSQQLTGTYFNILTEMAKNGQTFENQMILMTGVGQGSIGAEILKGLLTGGAKVVVTTSRYNQESIQEFQNMYQSFGAKGSMLMVVPFNAGSKQDIDTLIQYIYNSPQKGGLGWDLDFILPFAAIPVQGKSLDGIDSQAELAYRIMLTNVLRLMGNVKNQKFLRGLISRPTQVILPLSENHGLLGFDGLYSEAKISLETLYERWYSEDWSDYLTIMGAVIGWTRGTGLMSVSNTVAQGLEDYGVRTFSATEMAFNILGLMHPTMVELCQDEPIWADLNGGLQKVSDLSNVLARIREQQKSMMEIRKALVVENAYEFDQLHGPSSFSFEKLNKSTSVNPRANMKFAMPTLKDFKDLSHAHQLNGMLDLEKVVVITGLGELGPWGNARTRWEMESKGEFSIEGCIEMAWMMGIIKHHSGVLKSGQLYSGWVDTKTNDPVADMDIKARYEPYILENAGIRFVKREKVHPTLDHQHRQLMQELILDQDFEPFEASEEEAQMFKRVHGDKADIFCSPSGGQWTVALKKGANLYIPKAMQMERFVAGQIPNGWNAARYGVPKDIIDQVEPMTLYGLISTAEALISSGITDPYEFYQYIHLTDMSTCIGSGVGGMMAQDKMFHDRVMDENVSSDILQESLANTLPAWISMLLLSSAGSSKTVMAACATAAHSLDSGVQMIQSGLSKVVIVGACDDSCEVTRVEFGNMKATSSSVKELSIGRSPREMSRPTTESRSGFMESSGSGIQVIMQAKLAIEMGVPIHGIVGLTSTAMDKVGRSVPAPGQGILSTARQVQTPVESRLMDIKYRKRQIELRRQQIKQWAESEYEFLNSEIKDLQASNGFSVPEHVYMSTRVSEIEEEFSRQLKEALNLWGNSFYLQNNKISPLRGALASFGLTVNDIGVGSFHGTGTQANDKNESDVVNKQMRHLGRTVGNFLPSVWQKYLTGHPKGPAAAWMLHGMLDIMETSLIPGNRNADNIDPAMKKFEYILYPSRNIQTTGIKAGFLKSFGFGQANAEVLIIHSDYILGALDEQVYNAYKAKRSRREVKAYRFLHESMTGKHGLVKVKNSPPFTPEQESLIYLNPAARTRFNSEKDTWVYDSNALIPEISKKSIQKQQRDSDIANQILKNAALQITIPSLTNLNNINNNNNNNMQPLESESLRGVGVDIELVSSIPMDNEEFLDRNFSIQEIAYCRSRPDPQSSFAGRWSAKEAVIKAICSFAATTSPTREQQQIAIKGAGAGLKGIEIVMAPSGAPTVRFMGSEIQSAVQRSGVREVKVSISHSGEYSVAVATAL